MSEPDVWNLGGLNGGFDLLLALRALRVFALSGLNGFRSWLFFEKRSNICFCFIGSACLRQLRALDPDREERSVQRDGVGLLPRRVTPEGEAHASETHHRATA